MRCSWTASCNLQFFVGVEAENLEQLMCFGRAKVYWDEKESNASHIPIGFGLGTPICQDNEDNGAWYIFEVFGTGCAARFWHEILTQANLNCTYRWDFS